ncbi:Neuropeptide Y receptor [Trichoplax sp. H2]|nr:Neuropeptide Y receptor [Trichoplax sp. H2]|eukprot:RDD43160.1 Neuropeptide Y receptor [Trichoplax sp. H2]
MENNTIVTLSKRIDRDITRNLYMFISVIAIIGNGFVCSLFIGKQSLLQHATNRFILLLAIVDSLTAIMVIISPTSQLLGNPYPYPGRGLGQQFFCIIIYSEYFLWAFGYISIYTIAMLSLERLCLVILPIFHKKIFTPFYANALIVLLIFIGLILSAPNLFQIRITNDVRRPCRFISLRVNQVVKSLIIILSFILQFFIPELITFACYVIIICRMRKIGLTPNEATIDIRSQRNRRSRRQVTLMIFVASIALFICWLPNSIYFTLIQFSLVASLDNFHFITKTLVVANSTINPIIYVTVNIYYRKLFVKTLRRLLSFRRKRHKIKINVIRN